MRNMVEGARGRAPAFCDGPPTPILPGEGGGRAPKLAAATALRAVPLPR
jgi:hypothetical protein